MTTHGTANSVAFLLQDHSVCCPQFPQPVRKSLPHFWSSVNLCQCLLPDKHPPPMTVCFGPILREEWVARFTRRARRVFCIHPDELSSFTVLGFLIGFVCLDLQEDISNCGAMHRQGSLLLVVMRIPSTFKKWRRRSAHSDAEVPCVTPFSTR
jgi:hypothetical protein